MINALEYQTTMPQLLLGVRTAIRNRADKFRAHADFIKVGNLGQSPFMPCFAVLPESMQIVQRYSGGVMLVERNLVIQIYDQATTNKVSMRRLTGYVEMLRWAIRDEGAFKAQDGNGRPNAFDWTFGNATTANTDVSIKGHKVRMSNIPITFRSKDLRETSAPASTGYAHIRDEEILDRIKNRVMSMPFARRVPYEMNDEAPKGHGLTMSFQINSAPVNLESHGKEVIDLVVTIQCTARIRPDEKSMLACAELAENVWRTLERDARFNGCLWNSETIGISYDEEDVRNERRYVATVSLAARKPEMAAQVLN